HPPRQAQRARATLTPAGNNVSRKAARAAFLSRVDLQRTQEPHRRIVWTTSSRIVGMNVLLLSCTALRLRLRIAAAVVLLGAAPALFGQAVAPITASQRDAFRAAYTAAQNGQDWRTLAQGLQNYPLYPYLEAAAMQHDIKTASPAQIDAYLERYAGMIPAGDLRKAELGWLAQQKDWANFQRFYRPGLGDTLTC